MLEVVILSILPFVCHFNPTAVTPTYLRNTLANDITYYRLSEGEVNNALLPSKNHAIYHSFCWIHVQGTMVPKAAYIDNSMYLFSLDYEIFWDYIKHYSVVILSGCWIVIAASCHLSLDHDKDNKYLHVNENDALLFDTYFNNDIGDTLIKALS